MFFTFAYAGDMLLPYFGAVSPACSFFERCEISDMLGKRIDKQKSSKFFFLIEKIYIIGFHCRDQRACFPAKTLREHCVKIDILPA